jgi:hypothetical protein
MVQVYDRTLSAEIVTKTRIESVEHRYSKYQLCWEQLTQPSNCSSGTPQLAT